MLFDSKGTWDFAMFLVSTENQTWQSETSMASSANCGQLNERESSREAVWGVCWWADNVTWCDCCQTFIASLVNHSELPLAKSPVGCQEPKPSRKPPCYSISWVLMSSLRQGRACRLMFSLCPTQRDANVQASHSCSSPAIKETKPDELSHVWVGLHTNCHKGCPRGFSKET